MSTYFKHFGNVNIKEVIKITNWRIGTEEKIIDVKTAIEEQYFYLTNGKDYLWLDTDVNGNIISFKRFGNNDPDFLIELIGNSISEYEIQDGKINYYYDDELSQWIEENTFFDELEKVA